MVSAENCGGVFDEIQSGGVEKKKGLQQTDCNPLYLLWCPERESNSHSCKNRGILSPLRLPIPPSGLYHTTRIKITSWLRICQENAGGLP
jgi:hypothetical protein